MLGTSWQKSRRSEENGGNCVEARQGWRKSIHSGGGNDCVEVNTDEVIVGIRDTKDRAGGELAIGAGAWQAFLAVAAS
jgi:hypothetical protein